MKQDAVLRELQREIQIRQRVYPRWIVSGKIHEGVAYNRLNALMQAYDDLSIKYGITGTDPELF